MMRYQRREIALAACFSALAGYVDALGFITLGGYFVSFMTGNTTRLGIELAGGRAGGAALAGGIIALRIFHFDKVNPAPKGAFFMPATALNYGNWLSCKPKSAGRSVTATT